MILPSSPSKIRPISCQVPIQKKSCQVPKYRNCPRQLGFGRSRSSPRSRYRKIIKPILCTCNHFLISDSSRFPKQPQTATAFRKCPLLLFFLTKLIQVLLHKHIDSNNAYKYIKNKLKLYK